MRFEGTVTIRAPREAVWSFLTDPEKVSRCAPGVESLEVLSPERFRVTASVGFGSVRATFSMDAEWFDLVPREAASMKLHGTAPGSAVDATSAMTLAEAEGGTEMGWSADVTVVGTIASIAARLMGSVAQRLTDAFFETVRREIEERREFWFGPVRLDQAEGKILGHNVAGPEGRIVLRKGRLLSTDDVARLRDLGRRLVYVAVPGTDDVGEDEAAGRIGQAAAGPGLRLVGAGAGRGSLVAASAGVLRVDTGRLARLNESDGIAFATLRSDTAVREGELVATVKVIPFALPAGTVAAAEVAAKEGGPLLRLDRFTARRVSVVLSGAEASRERLMQEFAPPLCARVGALGSAVTSVAYVTLQEEGAVAALAEAIRREAEGSVSLVVLAGETAILDRQDVAPRAVEKAGGEVVAFGAPVDPGHLLMLAYLGEVAVLGAPACARSMEPSVLDAVLPRLLVGERLTRADLAALGHGGLLEGIPERPHPRG